MSNTKNNPLKEIELHYDVQSIKYNGLSIWPLLRIKINEELRKQSGLVSRTLDINLNSTLKILSSLHFGLHELFRLHKYQFWAFSSSDRVKKLDGAYVDRVVGILPQIYPNSLLIENPFPLGHNIKRRNSGSHVLGQAIIFALTKLIMIFQFVQPKIENEDVLEEMLEDFKLNINYKYHLKVFRAQYKLMSFLIDATRPKAAFFVYASSSMGYIKAFKDKRIPVFEIQHGVINDKHIAYNVYKNFGQALFPDFLLTYGPQELKIFGDNNYFIDVDRVFPVGYYYLEKMLLSIGDKENEEYLRGKYSIIVTFSLQDPFEIPTFDFLIDLAKRDNTICYLVVPRNKKKQYPYNFPANMIIERNLNVYECLKISDFHSSINSTCVLEAFCFGLPNILYDYNKWATDYFGHLLKDTLQTKFVETPSEFLQTLTNSRFYSKSTIKEKSKLYFSKNIMQNLPEVIEKCFRKY